MSAPFVEITLSSDGEADSVFEAGQQMALDIWRQVVEQAGVKQGVELTAGLFSGAMSVLQAAAGNERTAELFHRFLKADADADGQAGRHGTH